MRHNAERYRILLRTESNPRARRILIDMIAELDGRPILSGIPIPVAKDGPPVVRRITGTQKSSVALISIDLPASAAKLP
jgi:hypothetical protein